MTFGYLNLASFRLVVSLVYLPDGVGHLARMPGSHADRSHPHVKRSELGERYSTDSITKHVQYCT